MKINLLQPTLKDSLCLSYFKSLNLCPLMGLHYSVWPLFKLRMYYPHIKQVGGGGGVANVKPLRGQRGGSAPSLSM